MSDLLNKRNIPNIIATQYDIVLNGCEVGGGSIRNHRADGLGGGFSIMVTLRKESKIISATCLEAFSYGAPPHGGIAWGLDRLIMIWKTNPVSAKQSHFPKLATAAI